MAPGTEFARDFCVGIGPLHLGVVLVYLLYVKHFLSKNTKISKSMLKRKS